MASKLGMSDTIKSHSGRPLPIYNRLRLKPGVVIDRANGYSDHAGARRITAKQPTSALRTKTPSIHITTIGGGTVLRCFACDNNVLFRKKRQRHMPRSRGALTILTVALCHARRLSINRITHRHHKDNGQLQKLVLPLDSPAVYVQYLVQYLD